jgi:aryl-alcohol dehydrogenase-like predicted oxidoreductase
MAVDIVRECWESGIRAFDTAQGYGDSERILGQILHDLGLSQNAIIISKFDPQIDHSDFNSMSKALDQTLRRLGVESLYGIMLHKENMLSLWDKGLKDILNRFTLSGKVQNIGISVYSPYIAAEALKAEGIDMVQLPSNILDRRFENAGIFNLAEHMNKKVYIRSVFLQGLLLMNPCDVPKKMTSAKAEIEKLEMLSKEYGLTKQEITLGYVKSLDNAHVLFGAETPQQVRENVSAWEKEIPDSLMGKIKYVFANVDEEVLNPSLW